MSKRLTVTYGDVVLYDDEPAKVTFSETSGGAFELKAGNEGPNVLEQLAAAMRTRAIDKPSSPSLTAAEETP